MGRSSPENVNASTVTRASSSFEDVAGETAGALAVGIG